MPRKLRQTPREKSYIGLVSVTKAEGDFLDAKKKKKKEKGKKKKRKKKRKKKKKKEKKKKRKKKKRKKEKKYNLINKEINE